MQNAALLNMARNALLVAGHEIGSDGDHWPVIKAAVHGLARAYDAMKIEEEVMQQLKLHMRKALEEYDALLAMHKDSLSITQYAELEKFVADLWQMYEARFADTAEIANHKPLQELKAVAGQVKGMMPWQEAATLLRTLDAAKTKTHN